MDVLEQSVQYRHHVDLANRYTSVDTIEDDDVQNKYKILNCNIVTTK